MIQLPNILPVTCHTDFIGPGSTFVAIQGMKYNGAHFIGAALKKGATRIVIEKEIDPEIRALINHYNAQLLQVSNARHALAQLSAQAFNYPTKKLKIIGITGTKGKSTTAFLVEHILAQSGYKTALLSTIYNKILDQQFPTQLTTQHPDYLHMFFNECVKAQIDYVIMEVAAQAHTLDRTFGIEFDGFIFTNFSQEHGEFYATIDDYFDAKKSLLKQTKIGCPIIINTDDSWCTPLKEAATISVSAQKEGDYQLSHFQSTHTQSTFSINHNNNFYPISSNLLGEFNGYNITMAFALCHQLGLSEKNIIDALNQRSIIIPGRLEQYKLANNALCIIDYAHNPSSYQSVLSMLAMLTNNLIVVCGAGGDRDKLKRPLMGKLATQFCHTVILTSDNPRSEDPKAIIQDIMSGIAFSNLSKVIIELDREQAIKKACALSSAGTIIALLGKGPDTYQLIGNQKLYFNEREIVQNIAF